MKVIVESTCTGCGLCLQICPDVFEFNEDNLAIVKVAIVPTELEESCREAAGSCPVEAIKITE